MGFVESSNNGRNQDLYRHDGTSGAGQDLYQHDGTGHTGDDGGEQSQLSPEQINAINQWSPDPSSQSDSAVTWRRQNQELADDPIRVDGQGFYQVQPGDDLGSIALRAVDTVGAAQSEQERRSMAEDAMAEIIDLNRERYPTLTSNPDFVGSSWKLRMPEWMREEPPIAEQPEDCPEDCPPRDTRPDRPPPMTDCFPDYQFGRPPRVVINNYYFCSDMCNGNSYRPVPYYGDTPSYHDLVYRGEDVRVQPMPYYEGQAQMRLLDYRGQEPGHGDYSEFCNTCPSERDNYYHKRSAHEYALPYNLTPEQQEYLRQMYEGQSV